MRKVILGMSVFALLICVALLRSSNTPTPVTQVPEDLHIEVQPKNPWNHLKFNNRDSTFRFLIMTDRTGGERKGIFEHAIKQVNWLQPEFVVSVGDLIQGGTKDVKQLNKEWKEFNGFIDRLEAPFFYVVGNHDIGNDVMKKRWQEQFGRTYYHFVYKDVLFLMLNSEDPPGKGSAHFSAEQIAFAKKILGENANVRWTLVFVHKPVWTYGDVKKIGWTEIEEALKDRKYTVFAGHKHRYQRYVRNGQEYYMLATTGGSSRLRGVAEGEFDHMVWVTMQDDGPVLANLMVKGIFSEDIGPGGKDNPKKKK